MADETKACGNNAMGSLINVGTVQSYLRQRIEQATNPIVRSHLAGALERIQRALVADSEGCLRAARPRGDQERRPPKTKAEGPQRVRQ